MRYKKLGTFTVLMCAAALAFSACSSPEEEPTGGASSTGLTTEPVTLTVDWWGNADRAAQMEDVIAAFTEKYPNITITPMYTDFATYFTQLDTMIAAGNAPDVITMQDGFLRAYAESGVLLDLDSVSDQLSTADFPESTLSAGRIDNTLYALSIANSNMAIVANKTMLDEYGITLPDDHTWTWEELRDIGVQISEACAGECVGIDHYAFQANVLLVWVRQYPGEDFFDEQGNLILKAETLADYWEYMLSLQTSGASPSASSFVESYNAGQSAYPISTGKAALGFYADTWITQVAGVTGDEIELLRYPVLEGAPEDWSWTRASQLWTISAKSEHPAEAALFVDFIANNADAQRLFGTSRGLPANPRVLTEIESELAPNDLAQVVYGEDIAQVTGAAYMPPPGSSVEMTQLLQTYGEYVLFEQMTPQEAADEFIAALEESMARAEDK